MENDLLKVGFWGFIFLPIWSRVSQAWTGYHYKRVFVVKELGDHGFGAIEISMQYLKKVI